MANTLKFGNGEWYGKKDTILAYNDENSNYKPLPFNFSRASKATVVNKDGLIEEVGSGQPRIDYKDNSKGALLLEPSRTNYQPYSTDFSVWGLSGATVNINYGLSPDGLNNSTLITEGTGSAQHRIVKGSPASSGIYTLSCFVKNKVGNHQAYIDMGAVTGFFNFDTKTMFSAAGTTSVEIWSDDWYRISITSSSNITPTVTFLGIGKNNNETFQGDGSSAIEFFAPQLEEGSYATSYIPTSGSAVTRLADVCNNAGNTSTFNDNKGVLYVEVKGFKEIPSDSGYITISSTSVSFTNAVVLQFRNNGDLRFYFGGSASANIQFIDSSIDFTDNNKIAVQYDSNGSNYKMFVNGVSISRYVLATNQSVSGLSELNFNYSNLGFLGEVKDVRTYNTALTDQELIALTQV